MDFALSEEQSAIFDMAKAFGEEHIAPHAMAWEKTGTIPKGRFFPSTECVVCQWHRDRHVDPDHTDVDALCEIARGVAVTGKDCRAVSVFVIHSKANRLFIAARTNG